jgi:hypothetical protein
MFVARAESDYTGWGKKIRKSGLECGGISDYGDAQIVPSAPNATRFTVSRQARRVYDGVVLGGKIE